MARDLQFVYGTTTIGGASTNTPVDIYRIRHGYPRSTFSCEFLVSGADQPTFAANCAAVESALRTPRQKLTITIGGNSMTSLDPTTAVNSGFNADPTCERVSEAIENWGLVRRYRFAVTFDRPGDLTGQLGRRDETVTVHSDLMKRRVVTFQGTWTAMPGNDARAQYAAQSGTHFTSVLTSIDATATWVKVSEDQSDDDTDKTLNYRTVFWEVVNGRRESDVSVELSPAGVATVTIVGTYVQTLSPTTSARTNYTNNEAAHSAAVLSALGITGYELVKEITRDNEQDQTLTFTRVYRELIHQQSPGVTDDATIILDTIELTIQRNPINDSAVPTAASAGQGGTPVNSAPPVGAIPTTQSRTGATTQSADSGKKDASGTTVRKLVNLEVRYTAWINRSVTDLKGKWDNVLRGYMYSLLASKLKLSATLVRNEAVQLDVPNNRILCTLSCQGLEGTLLALDMNVAIAEDMGVLATPLLGGKPNKYLLQQGPTRVTYTKTVRAEFVTDSFSIESLFSVPPASNLVLLSRTRPTRRTREYGVVGLGLSTLSITESQFQEEWLLVGSNAGAGGNGGGSGGAGAQGAGAGAIPGVPSGGGGGRSSAGTIGIGALGAGGSGGFGFSDFNSIFGIGQGLQVNVGS